MPESSRDLDSTLLQRYRTEAHHSSPQDQHELERCCAPYGPSSSFPAALKAAAALDLRECRYSREQVAEGLSRILGREITVDQINAYTAQSKVIHRFPAELVPAWVRVTGSRRLLDLLCAHAGMWLADQTEHDFADFGRAAIAARKTAEVMERLRGQLWPKL